VKALKSLRRRIPEGAEPDDVLVADEARDVIYKVMRGEVLPDFAPHQLKAATYVRTEICGPVAQKLEHTGADGGPVTVSINLKREK
jgi:hypothetical protein